MCFMIPNKSLFISKILIILQNTQWVTVFDAILANIHCDNDHFNVSTASVQRHTVATADHSEVGIFIISGCALEFLYLTTVFCKFSCYFVSTSSYTTSWSV
ncbi:hypothetical protein BpHYR1_000807 [Brachionus plicatilis]|uniref:Uncharacterized protein n=1 Tax=Brachionus plicatilis TaxID=10195 RepID=A0A3M7PJM0_BRAPC|nr:hypothetical protein BpHYR1_000807 [Brachionus plicatilis]